MADLHALQKDAALATFELIGHDEDGALTLCLLGVLTAVAARVRGESVEITSEHVRRLAANASNKGDADRLLAAWLS